MCWVQQPRPDPVGNGIIHAHTVEIRIALEQRTPLRFIADHYEIRREFTHVFSTCNIRNQHREHPQLVERPRNTPSPSRHVTRSYQRFRKPLSAMPYCGSNLPRPSCSPYTIRSLMEYSDESAPEPLPFACSLYPAAIVFRTTHSSTLATAEPDKNASTRHRKNHPTRCRHQDKATHVPCGLRRGQPRPQLRSEDTDSGDCSSRVP